MKNSLLYRGFRYPPEIISHVVWLYFRLALSFRDIEELMASRGRFCRINFFGHASLAASA